MQFPLHGHADAARDHIARMTQGVPYARVAPRSRWSFGCDAGILFAWRQRECQNHRAAIERHRASDPSRPIHRLPAPDGLSAQCARSPLARRAQRPDLLRVIERRGIVPRQGECRIAQTLQHANVYAMRFARAWATASASDTAHERPRHRRGPLTRFRRAARSGVEHCQGTAPGIHQRWMLHVPLLLATTHAAKHPGDVAGGVPGSATPSDFLTGLSRWFHRPWKFGRHCRFG